ncbi:MAG: 50S ribosome-binding GTPase [Planctomycetia bacterium]|nr:50S ribosome-binding GTPase [Planctomycetia bacterium]
MWSAAELIVAPATVAGVAARAIVRIAGDDLEPLLRRMVVPVAADFPRAGEPPRLVPARLAGDGLGRDWGELAIDVLCWPGPGGPIGGPLAELQLPASRPLVDAVIAEACRHGARLARGGEFTLRAFLAGRLDLMQAEAVLAVVDARTPDELTAALDRMAGGAGQALGRVRDELIDLLADIEAAIDFADETTPDAVPATPAWSRVAGRLDHCADEIGRVAEGLARRDAGATDLPRVVLVGRPNIGKSSLFNALIGREAALVADESGTTRDWLEARMGGAAAGRECVLVDLAGLDDPWLGGDDAIGAASRARALAEVARADVVVACRDADGEPFAVPGHGPRIDVITRTDIGAAAIPRGGLATSSRTGVGIDDLRQAIGIAIEHVPPPGVTATARMAVGADAAKAAIAAARRQAEAAIAGAPVDESIIAAGVRSAVEALGEVTGAALGTELLDRIFSRHCIGK